jgi:uncharacterized protein (TIGR02453 family)
MFTRKTFEYFELAKKNKNNARWFEKNKEFYQENVHQPLSEFVLAIHDELQGDLPRIEISPRSITRPLRPKNKVADGAGLVKTTAHITISEKRTSLFEWNPGIYFQIGADRDDNFFGLGLYMVSSRQLSRLRDALFENFNEIDLILSDRRLKKVWGGILGEKYKRFPKGFDPNDPRSQYLWHKQFYLGLELSKKDLTNKNFQKQAVTNLKVAVPFFKWVRHSVGTYKTKVL